MSEQRNEDLGVNGSVDSQQDICFEVLSTDPGAQLLNNILGLAFPTSSWGICYLNSAGLVECVIAGEYDDAVAAILGGVSYDSEALAREIDGLTSRRVRRS